jgi:hypothetical protein
MSAWNYVPTPVRHSLRSVRLEIRRAIRSPFAQNTPRNLLVHCAHHRQGSTWFGSVLRAIADEYGLRFQSCGQEALRPDTDIFLQDHSLVDVTKLPPYVGSHMIRDPRDVIVSGYFYHLWTKEKWAHAPMQEVGGRSYQEYLNSLSQEDGILYEIDDFVTHDLQHMVEWNYDNPNFVEVKYEEIIADQESVFRRIFRHYGFNTAAIKTSLGIAKRRNFESRTKRKVGEVLPKSHLRSGRPGQWREVFTAGHIARSKEVLADALIKLGYETGHDW